MFRLHAISAIINFGLLSAALGQGIQEQPDPLALARAGQASIMRFGTESASWTTTNMTPNGVAFVVEVIATPNMRRSVLSVEVQGRREELARIIQKDDHWYVIQGGKASKYRPFEAPFDIPTAYMYLAHSNPQFVTEGQPNSFGTFEKIKGGIAIYRRPLAEPLRKQLENTIAESERFKQQNPGQAVEPEAARTMLHLKDLLANGLSTSVEVKSGLLVEFGTPERRTNVTDLRWIERVDAKDFDSDGRTWDDFSQDPTNGDRNDLLMLGHCGVWRPGMKSPETDGRLLDLKTGRFRRIPFRGDMTSFGCFSKDRSRVIVTGLDTTTSVLGLYEIDLKTTENRQLGGKLLASGFSLFPSLSPDGKTVVVLHKGASGRTLEVQVCLVDLATGIARPLGDPRDTGPVSWFPDGKGLLIVERDTTDASKPSIETICRMDLSGRVMKLCSGSSPVFLGDATKILFEDRLSRTWKICNLDGKEVKDYVDGMKGHAFPAPSPDGKRLVMMHFQTGKAPEPLVFAIGSSEGKSVTSTPGLWTKPAWR